VSYKLHAALRAADVVTLVEKTSLAEVQHAATVCWGRKDEPVCLVTGPYTPDFEDQDILLDANGRVELRDVDGEGWAVILEISRPLRGEDIK
jgi:hypothetical protein